MASTSTLMKNVVIPVHVSVHFVFLEIHATNAQTKLPYRLIILVMRFALMDLITIQANPLAKLVNNPVRLALMLIVVIHVQLIWLLIRLLSFASQIVAQKLIGTLQLQLVKIVL